MVNKKKRVFKGQSTSPFQQLATIKKVSGPLLLVRSWKGKFVCISAKSNY